MTSRLPLNVIAPVLIAIPVLALGIWLSSLWYAQSKQAVETLADQKIDQIHDLVTLKINGVVSVPPSVCLLNEHLLDIGFLDPDDLPAWRETFFEQMKAFDVLSAITWGEDIGKSAWVARYADGNTYWDMKNDPDDPTMLEWILDESGNIAEEPTTAYEYDLFSRPWYMTPKTAGRPAWSEPYVWAGAEDSDVATVGISYGRPIYDADGHLVGVMDSDISLNDLSGFLQSIPIGRTGVAILSSSDGKLLATSNRSRVVADDGSLSGVEESTDDLIRQLGSILTRNQPERMIKQTVMLNDEPHLIRVSRAGQAVGLNWYLGTIIPESDFLAEIDTQFEKSLFMSIGAVLLVLIFGTATFWWLLEPLRRLIAALKQIGHGRLETRVQLGRTIEYVKLGDAINEMTSNLEHAHQKEDMLKHELDHRVKNMLTQIVVLCQQTVSQCTTDRNIVEELSERVTNLSGAHELLANREHIGLPLEDLVTECAKPYLSSSQMLETSGPDIFLKPKVVMCLSLVVNELATNSCKHGAFSREDGLVNVHWTIEGTDDELMLKLEWIETRGRHPGSDMKPSFGTQVIQELIPYEIGGTAVMDFTETGLHFTATVPGEYFQQTSRS